MPLGGGAAAAGLTTSKSAGGLAQPDVASLLAAHAKAGAAPTTAFAAAPTAAAEGGDFGRMQPRQPAAAGQATEGFAAAAAADAGSDRHLRLRLAVTADDVQLDAARPATGTVPALPHVNGDFLYVVRVDGEVHYAGTFIDPLVGYGRDFDGKASRFVIGHEEFITVSVPALGALLEQDREVRIDFYLLDGTVPHDTRLDPASAERVAEAAEPVGAGIDVGTLREALRR